MEQTKNNKWLWLIVVLIIIALASLIYFVTNRPNNSDQQTNNANQSPANTNSAAVNSTVENKNTAAVNSEPTTETKLLEPTDGFLQRITKKLFGIYITPATSPVQPERFTGYHTGVDAEFTPTPLQNATIVNPHTKNFDEGVKPWINASVILTKLEKDKATPVKVWWYTDSQGKVVEVKAIAPGTVVLARRVSGYGGVVVIRHDINGQEILVLYGHLDPASLVAIDTQVSAGQVIGQLGEGYTAATDYERKHLHLGMLKGKTVDLRGYVSTEKELLAGWYNPLDFYK